MRQIVYVLSIQTKKWENTKVFHKGMDAGNVLNCTFQNQLKKLGRDVVECTKNVDSFYIKCKSGYTISGSIDTVELPEGVCSLNCA